MLLLLLIRRNENALPPIVSFDVPTSFKRDEMEEDVAVIPIIQFEMMQ